MELSGKMQFTLVAFYGSKPEGFFRLIKFCQDELARVLLSSFHPYDIDQVHGTLIGLEGLRQNNEILNRNFHQYRSASRSMNLKQILELLVSSKKLPLALQIGGFKPYENYHFTSQGKHPFLRSFGIRNQIAVAMGWPTDFAKVPGPLDEIRRDLQDTNVLHLYHKKPEEVDNDFFFVLGRVDRFVGDELLIQKTENVLRNLLAGLEPIILSLGLENLSVVGFLDTQLPLATSCCFSLDDARQEKVLAKIMSLYQET